MQIHELPDVTAIGSGGYFATDNGSQTTKIDYDALAKAIIEQYSASTLAGSAQSVKAALDGIKADSVLTRGASETVTASTDVNNYVTPGTYFFNSGTKALNAPNNSGYFRLEVVAPNGSLTGTNRFRYQEAVTSEGRVFTRRLSSSDGGQAWVAQDWAETPTTTEITTLTSAVGTLTYKCFKQGKVIGVALQIAVSDEIPANTVIVEGLPLASKGANYTVVPFSNNAASALTDKYLTAEFRRAGDTYNEILTRYAIPANGSIRMNFTYLAEN